MREQIEQLFNSQSESDWKLAFMLILDNEELILYYSAKLTFEFAQYIKGYLEWSINKNRFKHFIEASYDLSIRKIKFECYDITIILKKYQNDLCYDLSFRSETHTELKEEKLAIEIVDVLYIIEKYFYKFFEILKNEYKRI